MRKTFFISLLALCLTASAWADNVAKIGTTEYATLAEAISAATAGQTVQLIADINQENGVLINKNLTLDLNNHTYTCTSGSNVNSRAIKITAGTVAIQNGTIIGEPTANFNGGCYGPLRIEGATANVTLKDLTLQNGRIYGLGIKLVEGYLKMEDCVVISENGGGGLEVAGTADVKNCTFTQTGLDVDHKWISTCLATCDNGVLNVEGGTYTSEHYSLYIYTSGGEMDIDGGNFTGDVVNKVTLSSYPDAVGTINIIDGSFEGVGDEPISFTVDNSGATSIVISGGSFDAPVPAAYCAEGFVPVTEPNAQGKYVVELVNVAKIGDTYFATLDEAVTYANANAGSEIVLLADIARSTRITLTANTTINLNGKTLSMANGSWLIFVKGGATLTIDGTTANSAVYGGISLGAATNNNGSLVLNGGSYSCGYNTACIHINGTCLSSDVTINGATLTNDYDNAIQFNGKGVFTITDATITGATGIYIKAGQMTITNSTVTGTMAPANYSYYGNGANATGDGIVVDACNYPGGAPTVNIVSGTFSGTKNAVGNYNYQGTSEPAVGNITGGTYDSQVPEELCAQGFVSVTAPNAQGLYIVEQVDYQREVTNTYGTLCLPKSGVVIGATVFQPSYKTCSMIFFDEVAENRIEGGHAYLFQRNANSGRVSVKYDDANAQDAEIVDDEAMVGKSYTENTLIDSNYDHCIVWNDKYLHVTSANVYVGAKCAYIDLNQIPDSYVAPVPGRRRISFQDASVNEVTGIEDIEANENAGVQKVMVNGQLYILRGEQIYNVAGQVVK